MKRMLLLVTAAIAASTLSAQTAKVESDTIKTISRAENIVITRTGNQTVIRAFETEEGKTGGMIYTYTVTEEPDSMYSRLRDIDPDNVRPETIFRFPFATNSNRHKEHKFKPSRFVTGLRYIYWGWNFNYDYKSGTGNCFEAGVADLIGIEWETSRFTRLGLGLGFGMQRVTAADHTLFATEGDAITTIPTPESAAQEYARLDNWRIQLPLYWRQRLAGRFGFSLAAILNFNTYSEAHNRFHLGNTTYTEQITGLRQRLVTCDVMATLGLVDALGVYVKWSPVTTFSSQYGPAYKTISVGINLNF